MLYAIADIVNTPEWLARVDCVTTRERWDGPLLHSGAVQVTVIDHEDRAAITLLPHKARDLARAIVEMADAIDAAHKEQP